MALDPSNSSSFEQLAMKGLIRIHLLYLICWSSLTEQENLLTILEWYHL